MQTNIQTERLILRPFQPSDAPRLRELADNFAIARMLTRLPHPYAEGDAERWIGTHATLRADGQGYIFAIEKDGDLAGSVGVEAGETGAFELGYWLEAGSWGKGYATEAVRGVLAFAFDGLAKAYVRSSYFTDNRASARVLGKAGFLATGRCRRFHAVRGTEVELVEMVLLRDAFIRDDSTVKQVYTAA